MNLKSSEELNKNLPLDAALAKDYKIFNYGPLSIEYSIIYLPPNDFYQHYENDLKNWFINHPPESDIYLLISVFKMNNELQREFMFTTHKNEKHQNFLEGLLKQLKMHPVKQYEPNWYLWKDPSCAISRKLFDK